MGSSGAGLRARYRCSTSSGSFSAGWSGSGSRSPRAASAGGLPEGCPGLALPMAAWCDPGDDGQRKCL
jgi:hypothetical protein